jgi:hypothetical protein
MPSPPLRGIGWKQCSWAVLIDPRDPGEDGWLTADLLEPFAGVWHTNRNHSRAAAAFRAAG